MADNLVWLMPLEWKRKESPIWKHMLQQHRVREGPKGQKVFDLVATFVLIATSQLALIQMEARIME